MKKKTKRRNRERERTPEFKTLGLQPQQKNS